MDIATRANALIEALPFIKEFHRKTVVIKYGGNAMINDALKEAVINDIVMLTLVGVNAVLIHGGGPEITETLSKLGKESRFVNGMRYTDEETMEVVQMVLAGKINKDLVKLIEANGGRAAGLSGFDGSMLISQQVDGLGRVGKIKKVNAKIINDIIAAGYIPVISTTSSDGDGGALNVNADEAAALISIALGATKLILLTDVCGIMKNQQDPTSLISVVRLSDMQRLKDSGILTGGMIPKADCCATAVAGGVERAHIIDGRVKHSILIEILSEKGVGTMIIK
jgi:acetylglutamate kinase